MRRMGLAVQVVLLLAGCAAPGSGLVEPSETPVASETAPTAAPSPTERPAATVEPTDTATPWPEPRSYSEIVVTCSRDQRGEAYVVEVDGGARVADIAADPAIAGCYGATPAERVVNVGAALDAQGGIAEGTDGNWGDATVAAGRYTLFLEPSMVSSGGVGGAMALVEATATPIATPTQAPTATPAFVELRNDDGSAEGCVGLGGTGKGHLVTYDTEGQTLTLEEVELQARVIGPGAAGRRHTVHVMTPDYEMLATKEFHPGDVSSEPRWFSVPIPHVTVRGIFHVLVATNARRDDGTYVCYDDSSGGGQSSMTKYWEPSAWTLSRPREATNWMIRVRGTVAGEGTALSVPEVPSTLSFEETVERLETPEELSTWMLQSIRPVSDYEEWMAGVRHRAMPRELFVSREGNCADMAIFACYVLEQHGYEGRIVGLRVDSDPRAGHSVCAFHASGRLYTINNGDLHGPFGSLEEIAARHHEAWSAYQVYESWQRYQQIEMADEVHERE